MSAVEESEFALEVRSRVESAAGIVTLELESPEGAQLPGWTPGAHIDIAIPDSHKRQYSLCGNPVDRSVYRISVLYEPAGKGGSRWIHENIAVGSTVTVSGPRNHFPLEPAEAYLFVAGGIGITPMLPMIRQAEAASAEWSLLYGGRTRASMAFLDELAAYGDRVRVAPQDEFGLLDLTTRFAEPAEGHLIYACGPEAMLQAAERESAHWPAGSLHFERFSARADADLSRDSEFDVVVDSRDLTIRIHKGESIVEGLRAAGVKIRTGCSEGTCGTCETEVLEGVPDHRDSVLTDAEHAAGDTMTPCVSRALSARLVLDL